MGAEGRGAGTRAEETALLQEGDDGPGPGGEVRFGIEFEGGLFVSLIFIGALRERLRLI